MNEKQLTIKEIIKEIGAGRCLSCRERIDISITYHWRIPLCKKCRVEMIEDMEEVE